MNLLLLLSAILTALTGVGGGVRPVEIAARHQVLAAEVERIGVMAMPHVAGHRHLLGDFGPQPVFASTSVANVVTAAPRLYLDRPRA